VEYKKKPTPRQKKVAKILIGDNGKSVSAAMKEAGFSEAYARNPHLLTATKSWKQLLDEIPDEDITRTLRDGLHNATKDGSLPDHAVRLQYAKEIAKLKDKYPVVKTDMTSGGKPLTFTIVEGENED
jgi:hypothetical protein